jgi:hypothetical protein
MYRCLLVIFYDIRDFLIDIVATLKKLHCVVETYPLYRYASDPYDQVPDYFDRLTKLTHEFNPDIIIFICLQLTTDELKRYRHHHHHRYFVLYSSHDPDSWFVPELDLKQKAPHFDLVLTSCRESIKWYQQAGTKTTLFTTFGCQPQLPVGLTEPITQDVSMCIMSLYDHLHDQLIPRRQLLDQLTRSPNWSGSQPKYTFKLYGPEEFKTLYPAHYAGYIPMSDLPRVFRTSRINLSLHTFGIYPGYLNSRSIQILAARGLLVMDPVPGISDILVPDQECILLNLTDPIGQLEKLITDPGRLSQIALRGQQRVCRDYTWDHWSDLIWREFHRTRFSDSFYAAYNVGLVTRSDDVATYDHWDRIGRHRGYIGVIPVTARDFDVVTYAQRYQVTPDQAWAHWLTIGQKSGSIYPCQHLAPSSNLTSTSTSTGPSNATSTGPSNATLTLTLTLTFSDLPFRDKINLLAKLTPHLSNSRMDSRMRMNSATLEEILKLFQHLHRMYPAWNPSTLLREYMRLDSVSQ